MIGNTAINNIVQNVRNRELNNNMFVILMDIDIKSGMMVGKKEGRNSLSNNTCSEL